MADSAPLCSSFELKRLSVLASGILLPIAKPQNNMKSKRTPQGAL
ncbi:MAG: hypothetical protein WDM70_02060 [Nitrosomonadales bacterium]